MIELKPIDAKCVSCKAPAVRALEIKLALSKEITINVLLCPSCSPTTLKTKLVAMPTHHPATLTRAKQFPPAPGEWFKTPEGGVVLGCPSCKNTVEVTAKTHHVEGDQLKPSFICPHCGLHIYFKLEGWNA